MNIKRRVLVSSLWSAVGSGAQQVIGFFLFIYIARGVTPADVGLVVFAMVFIEILAYVVRWGQVEVLQRQQDLTDRTLSTSFWALAVGGLAATAMIAAGAEMLRTFWDQALFGMVLLLLAPIAAFKALTAVPEAILKRRFDYRSLAIREWLATLTGGLAAVYLVYRGFGVYALVAQRLVAALARALVGWTTLRWHPRLSFDFGEAIGLGRAGGVIMLAGFSGVINGRITEGMTGFGLGATQLGHLRLSSRFFNLITQLAVNPVANVALTTFSTYQRDLPALRRVYLRLTQFMALASLPMFFGLGAIANVFVPVLLGPKWSGSIIVMQVLAFSRLAAPINYFFGPAMIAIGKARIVLRQTVVQVILTAVLIAIGAQFGILGVLAAIVLRTFVVAAYNIYALRKHMDLDTSLLLGVLLPPVLACAAMVTAVVLTSVQLGGTIDNLLLLGILCVVGASTYGAALLLGDLTGLWRGYVRSAADSLAGAIAQRGATSATMTSA